jgi:hypothetical protein
MALLTLLSTIILNFNQEMGIRPKTLFWSHLFYFDFICILKGVVQSTDDSNSSRATFGQAVIVAPLIIYLFIYKFVGSIFDLYEHASIALQKKEFVAFFNCFFSSRHTVQDFSPSQYGTTFNEVDVINSNPSPPFCVDM